ncbi:MAG: DNA polymerase III subunit alpha, partial [Desulfovibrio sp.]|nr:DNA polymerase III subunit alpha [Desulfovibrio sp.]
PRSTLYCSSAACDVFKREVLFCIQTQTNMDDPDRPFLGDDEVPVSAVYNALGDPNRELFREDNAPASFASMRGTGEFYYKSYDEMFKPFAHVPEAVSNTMVIAESCDVELDFGHHYFPVYPLPEGESLDSEFRRLAREGLEKRLEKHPDRENIDAEKYRERLEYELKVICEMGFPGYFLIVQEFINWAKDRDIPVGPGRGSAAGSLVAWALRITNLDPIPYNLLFERFLNIERISLPDIDVDFCERRRGEVIQHMVDRYGKDSVAQITTFGTMKARSVVRDVGRALGMTYADTDRIAKLVPESLGMTIEKAMDAEENLKRLYKEDAEVRKLIDIARRLEGMTRHASTHAAGLVVSDKPMDEYLPLYTGKRGEIVTQFDGPMTEKTGLVKFDFLGLRTMTQIQDTLDNIKSQGKEVPELDTLALTDKAVYDLYSRGDTDGVFQVESSGMRQYLRMLKPSCFEDVIAMLALYRPGPLGSGMVDEFIKRKHGQAKIDYLHDSLRDCLAETYGVIVYQEQVMQIARIIARYSLGGADLLRRAMGKKKKEVMAAEREKFVAGALENQIDEALANRIFDLMEEFASYGFNKSHSAAYALISYFTAWLKVHYKVEFMAALLTSEMGDQDKLLKYISTCRDMRIEVVAPSVNDSMRNFSALGDKIVFGLGGIKNVGDEAIKSIAESRQERPYSSLFDLLCRVNLRKVTKRVLESLIKSGACDCLGASRAALIGCLDIALKKAAAENKRKSSQAALMGSLAPGSADPSLTGLGFVIKEGNLQEMDEEQKMRGEKEALGFYLSSHPLQTMSWKIKRMNLRTIEDCADLGDKATVKIAVLITNVKEIITKKGKRMAFLEVEDLTGRAEAVFMSRPYEAAREFANSEKPMLLTAQVELSDPLDSEADGKSFKLIGQSLIPLERVSDDGSQPIVITISKKNINETALKNLRDILDNFRGEAPVQARVERAGYWCLLNLDDGIRVKPDHELALRLRNWEQAG